MGLLPTLVVVLAMALNVGCASPQGAVYLTGDSTAVGARVFIDGKLVGVMSAGRFTGEPTPDSEIRKGELFGTLDFTAERGAHRIVYVSNQKDTVSDSIFVTGETYWSVNFEQQRRVP